MGRLLSASEHHERTHRLKDGRLPKQERCARCVEAHARCVAKITFKCRAEADKKALNYNIEHKWLLGSSQIAYRCRWCWLWHTTTATTSRQYERVEKMHTKWLRKTGQKKHEWDDADKSRWTYYREDLGEEFA